MGCVTGGGIIALNRPSWLEFVVGRTSAFLSALDSVSSNFQSAIRAGGER
jgi:hypothetical protein